MSPVCDIVRNSLDDYLSDALAVPQQRMLREHLASCRTCRDAAALREPALLFARPIRDELPDEDRQRILAAVRTGVDFMETERRLRGRSRRLLRGPAAAAAVAALVVLTASWRAGRSVRPLAESGSAVAAPPQKAIASAPLPAVTAAAGLQSAGLAGETGSSNSGATVYDWNPGPGREEPRVVWIVDRGLDI